MGRLGYYIGAPNQTGISEQPILIMIVMVIKLKALINYDACKISAIALRDSPLQNPSS